MKTVQLNSATKELLIAVIETPSTAMSVGEIRKSIKIIDSIIACENALALEDADFEFLAARFNATKFVKVSRDVIALADAIENAGNFIVDISGN